MKLANEIAEEVYREQKDIRDRFGVELGIETVKGIIAARLEPVARWMIEMYRTTGITYHDDGATRDFLGQALNLMFGYGKWEHILGAINTEQALAMLSEEKCDEG